MSKLCAADSLNLVATTDFKKIVGKSKFASIHLRAFSKLTQIWNGSRKPKGSEAIGDIIGKQIGYPVCTLWNSFFECTQELLGHEAKLDEMLEVTKAPKTDLPRFTTTELSYLKEYVMLMLPLTQGLNYLQGDKSTFYGRLLPTLFTIKRRLSNLMSGQNLTLFHEIAPFLLISFEERFEAELTLNESANLAIVAAVSHPQFKLRWVDCDKTEAKVRAIFEEAVNEAAPEALRQETVQQLEADGFLVLRQSNNQVNQVTGFLTDPRTDMKMLDFYADVKKVFKASNTPLCSSASIERIFNFADVLNHPKRGPIVPTSFEMCVVMKGNDVFRGNEKEMQPEAK